MLIASVQCNSVLCVPQWVVCCRNLVLEVVIILCSKFGTCTFAILSNHKRTTSAFTISKFLCSSRVSFQRGSLTLSQLLSLLSRRYLWYTNISVIFVMLMLAIEVLTIWRLLKSEGSIILMKSNYKFLQISEKLEQAYI